MKSMFPHRYRSHHTITRTKRNHTPITEMMHGSNSRPRQRTFTSCVECRRRKQRCNQAKDRPCNNCSRRYPPVLCTYQSSSPPPSFDRIVDLRDDQTAMRQDYQSADRGMSAPGPSYVQTTGSDISGLPATSMSDSYYDNSRTYYSNPSTRSDYRSYSSDTSSAQHVLPSNISYAPADQSYYQGGQMSYSSPPTTHGGYYSTSTTQGGGDWLSTNGDPGVFVGAGSADYYYVCDPDQGNPRQSSPRR